GVDRLSGETLWAFLYPEARPKGAPAPGVPPGMILAPDGRWLPAPLAGWEGWRNSAPIVQGDRVLIGPPDGASFFCLGLRDGRLLWKKPKGDDDRYVGGVIDGVVILVGSKDCRGIKLADGSEAWRLQTGMPSGLGVVAGGWFYLPLAREAGSGKPGIC